MPIPLAAVLLEHDMPIEAHPNFLKTIANTTSMLQFLLSDGDSTFPYQISARFKGVHNCKCGKHIDAVVYCNGLPWVEVNHPCNVDDGRVQLGRGIYSQILPAKDLLDLLLFRAKNSDFFPDHVNKRAAYWLDESIQKRGKESLGITE